MKKVILSIVLVAVSIITSLAQDQSQPSVTVRWQKEIKQPLDAKGNIQGGFFEEPPPILYKKASTTTNTLALIRVNFSYIKEGAEETKSLVSSGKGLEFSIPASSGIITNTTWYYASILMLRLDGMQGTGTVHIAFFEPSKNSSGKEDASGRQLSNWLDLPIILPNTGMPSVFGK
jgi:hypothetical protein